MLFYSETSTPEIIAGHSYGGLAAATREVVCSSTSTTRLSLLVSLNARYRALSTQATANMTLPDRLMLACSCRGDLARSSHAHNSIAIVNAPTSVVTCCQLSVTSLIICEAQAEGVLGGASMLDTGFGFHASSQGDVVARTLLTNSVRSGPNRPLASCTSVSAQISAFTGSGSVAFSTDDRILGRIVTGITVLPINWPLASVQSMVT